MQIICFDTGEPLKEEERAERIERAGEKLPLLADVAAQFGADISSRIFTEMLTRSLSERSPRSLPVPSPALGCGNHRFAFRASDMLRKRSM